MQRSIWLVMALALSVAAGHAVEWKNLRPQGYVSDFANVVDVASKGQLEAYCAKLENSTKAQLALVTIQSLEGEPIEDVARAIFNAWGVGHKDTNDGILLLISVGDHRTRLEVGGGLRNELPDSLASDILVQMRPALRQEHYGEALMAAAETVGGAISKARNVSLEAPLPRKMRRSFFDSIPWLPILGGIALIFWLMRSGGARGYRGPATDGGWNGGGLLTGLLLGNLMSRSTWGSRGSGGFDGYDSSDSFGGFGGGESGGGGASGDW